MLSEYTTRSHTFICKRLVDKRMASESFNLFAKNSKANLLSSVQACITIDKDALQRGDFYCVDETLDTYCVSSLLSMETLKKICVENAIDISNTISERYTSLNQAKKNEGCDGSCAER